MLTFEMPLPPQLSNGPQGSWRARHFGRKAHWKRLDDLVTLRKNPRCIAGMPWAKATAEIQMRTWREMDRDNANARLKPVLDWLQSRGYIQNDRNLDYTLERRVAKRVDLGITLVLRETA